MSGLKRGHVILDRKSLADIAIFDPVGFGKIAELAAGKL
jgi:ribosomal protein L20